MRGLAAGVAAVGAWNITLKDAGYHTTDELSQAYAELAKTCPDMKLSTRDDDTTGLSLEYVTMSRIGGETKKKALLVFGEHARELVTAESGLHFLKQMCLGAASKALDKVEFHIIPNANPEGRKKVEAGDYCKRTNERGVDLNRNFGDSHRESVHEKPGDQMNPGPKGFSEPESRIVRNLIDELKPELYLSVHSGAYLLGAPFGYTSQEAPKHSDDMKNILGPISEKYCGNNCPYGALAEMIGYNSPGCDIDYAVESGVPYAFTWEIYTSQDAREMYAEKAKAMRGEGDGLSMAAGLFFAGQKRLSSFVQTGKQGFLRKSGAIDTDWDDGRVCFQDFNPGDATELSQVLDNWSNAYVDLAAAVP
mmetsp:Transcript_44962/g.97673  ORF Transcript_44962/g.97673 Transcript_44962/m.97673 type:complete len:364 (-) Transcript_44962:33-1124(-)